MNESFQIANRHTVCHGIYMLNGDCFPKFFNSIKCNQQEMGCIFDTFTDKGNSFVSSTHSKKICAAHGQCHQQSLVFKVLRNKGDERCEDWAIDQIHVSRFLPDTVFLISISDPGFLPVHIESNFVAAFQTSTGSLTHLTVFMLLSLCVIHLISSP